MIIKYKHNMKKILFILIGTVITICSFSQSPIRWGGNDTIIVEKDTTVSLIDDKRLAQGAEMTWAIQLNWSGLDTTTAYVYPSHGLTKNTIRMNVDSLRLNSTAGEAMFEGTYLSTGKLALTIKHHDVDTGTLIINWYAKKE